MAEWHDDIFAAIRAHGIEQVAYVPDAGHAPVIDKAIAEPSIKAVPLTTEEEGVALLAGAWLGGDKGVLLMQSSGVGNIVNMLGLTRIGRFPLLMLITMRGQWNEFNPWQNHMGGATMPVLEAAGVTTETVDDPELVGAVVGDCAARVFAEQSAEAVILHQSLMPVKSFGK